MNKKQSEPVRPSVLENPEFYINSGHNPDFIPAPTRLFDDGTAVRVGCLQDPVVVASHHGGKFLTIAYTNTPRNAPPETTYDIFEWTRVLPIVSKNSNLTVPDDVRYTVSNTSVADLLIKQYHFGVDSEVDYQRPYVWELEDKVKLIETIFQRGSIGLFAFQRRPFKPNAPGYEIVDGKQRLRALCDYVEGRFAVQGFYYHELSSNDQHTIKDHSIAVYTMEEAGEEAILKLFLRVNRAGRPIDQAHIDQVALRLAVLQGK